MNKNKTPRAGLQTDRGAQHKNRQQQYSLGTLHGQYQKAVITNLRKQGGGIYGVQVVPAVTYQFLVVIGIPSTTTLEGYRDDNRCNLSKNRLLFLLDWQGPGEKHK